MRKGSRVFVLVTVGSLGALGALGACGSAASSFNPGVNPPGNDGSTSNADAQVPANDSGGALLDSAAGDAGIEPPSDTGAPPPDGAAGTDAGSPNVQTTFLAVHASANLFPFRLCFSTPSTGILPLPPYPDDPTQPMPETNFPGVPGGGASVLPPVTFAAGTPVTTYVVSAPQEAKNVSTTPGGETTCDQLICPGSTTFPCLAAGAYAALPPRTMPGGRAVLAVEGCLPQAFATGTTTWSAAQCGAGYDPSKGNLTLDVSPMFTASAAGFLTLQLAQLSPSFAPAAGAGLTYVDPSIDASVALALPASGIAPSTFTVPLSEAGVFSAYFVVTPASGAPVTESLASIQFFQAPSATPSSYFNSASTYFGAVVGDVTDASTPASLPDGAPNPLFDGYGLHVIAYPVEAK